VSYVVAAYWRARPGTEARIEEILREMTGHTLKEPGCTQYVAHRSVEDPTDFFLYEVYKDEAAFRAHTDADYFKRLVLGEAVPTLDSRHRVIYTPLE
jgi:quinol monooxygenase YgiN